MPPPIHQLVTFLYTADMAAAVHFYERILGLRLALDQGACRIYQVSSGSYLGICQRTDQPAAVVPDQVIVTLVSHQVDAWYEYLTGQGVVFEKAPALNPKYNIYHCFLRDPNGYLIEIQRFLDPAWDSQAEDYVHSTGE